MSRTLEYFGRPMSSLADVLLFNGGARHEVTPEQVRTRLLAGSVTHLELSPGDGTRYELVLSPITLAGQPGLCLMRMVGGEPIGRPAIVWDWSHHQRVSEFGLDVAADGLSNGNEWTASVMRWYLRRLCALEN